MRAKRIGDVQKVDNLRPHPAANKTYNHLRAQLENGDEINLLFTDFELKRAYDRAKKNPEDCPKVSFLRNLFD